MWSAIFGAEQALQEGNHHHHHPQQTDEQGGYATSPTHRDSDTTPMSRVSEASSTSSAPSPPTSSSGGGGLNKYHRAPPVSPADTVSSTPRSSSGDLPSSARSSFTRRPSLLMRDDDDDEDADKTALSMVLRRMNALMVRAGEHEFEKKTLVDQMDKDRERMAAQVTALERHVQDLKDQNTQLQYKIEYNSEPMLIERLQDMTDMRDALTGVKMQLEKDLEAKEKQLQELKDQLAVNDEALMQLQDELEEEKTQREQFQEQAASQFAEWELKLDHATKAAELAAEDKYSQLLGELELVAQERDATALHRDQLVSALAQKDHELETVDNEKLQEVMELAAELQQQQQASETRLAAMEQTHCQQLADQEQATAQRLAEWKQSSDARIQEKDHQIQQLKSEWTEQGNAADLSLRERIVELETQLEQQTNESENRINEMNQVMEDYKHDCMELWKLNEDLKQQLALASAETMLKEAEFRQKEFSSQSRVSELESQLEELQEAINRKEQELVMKEEEVISIREEAALQIAEAAAKRREEEEEEGGHHQPQQWQENAIRLLTEQVATAQRELSEAMQLNLHVNNRNTWLEDQHQQLTMATETANANAAAWGQQLQVVDEELRRQQQIVETHVRTIQEWEHHMATKDQEFALVRQEADAQKQQLEQSVACANEHIAALQSSLTELEAASAAASAAATAHADEIRHELENVRAANAALSQEVATFQAASIGSQPTASLAELEAVQSLNKVLESELDGLRDAAEALCDKERKVAELQIALESLHDEVNALKSANAEQERHLKTLQQELESGRERRVNLEEEIAQVKRASAASSNAAVSSQAKDDELETLREANWQMEDDLEVTKHRLTEATQQVETLEAQVNMLTAEKETLQEDLELAQSTLAEAESEIAEYTARNTTLETQVMNLQLSSEENMDSALEMEAKLMQATQELESVRAELQAKSELCAQLEQSVQDAQANVGDATQRLQDELSEAREKATKIQGELAHLKTGEQALQARVAELAHGDMAVTHELETVRAEKKALEHQLTQMQHSVRETTELVEKERAVSHHEITQALAAKRELQYHVDELTATLDGERAKLVAFQQQQHDQFVPLQTQVATLTQKNQNLIAESGAAWEEWGKKDAHAKGQLEKLRGALQEAQQELTKLKESFEAKDLEFQTLRDSNLTEISNMKATMDRLEEEKKKIVPELKQLRVDVEQLRVGNDTLTAERGALRSELESHKIEVGRLQTLLTKAEEAARSGTATAEQARALQEEKNRVVDELRQLEMVNHRLEETNHELETTLEKSKEFCEELSRRCEDKITELQGSLQTSQEERAAESAQLAIINGSLRHEIEQLAESRYEQERYIEELRLNQADLQAEKNVLAARAHRLTQELSQYTELPAEDQIADAHSQAPDLWELLSTGMEQLKADLELASKYASSIDGTPGLEGDDGPESEESLIVGS